MEVVEHAFVDWKLSVHTAEKDLEAQVQLPYPRRRRPRKQWAKTAQIGFVSQHLTSLRELIPGQSKSGGMLDREAQLF